MIHKTVVVGPFQCNCQLIACEKTNEAVLIDPGDDPERVLGLLANTEYIVKYILHTHAHLDHIGATREVRKKIFAPITLHRDDEVIYNNLVMQGQMFGISHQPPSPVEKFIEDDEILEFGECKVKVIHTPGHSPGGVCFHITGDREEKIFSGDTLFHRSIGRSDLWGGDGDLLVKSIKNRLLTLEGDLPVFPGHGPDTTIAAEKRSNPFLT